MGDSMQHTWLGHKIKQLGNWLGFALKIRGFNRLKMVNLQTGKVGYSYNARVNKGADLMASLLTGTSINSISSPLPPKYIALSTSVLTPAAGDTTLSGETAATGLARVLATIQNYVAPASLDGAASYDLFHLFTNSSGGTVTLQSAGLFDAVSTGNLFAEANNPLGSTVLNNGDQTSATWTVNI
jgi:hypothetical protein